MSSASQLPTLDEIREEFLDLDSSQERLAYLIELGDAVPDFPESSCVESNRVLGCQSMVWLIAEPHEDRLDFLATSDAPMVKGLIAILLIAYSGKTPKEILEFDIEKFLTQIHLKAFLSPMRSNGLHSMNQRIRQIAVESMPKNFAAASPIEPETETVRNVMESEWIRYRDDFPILKKLHSCGQQIVYLDNAASSQRPVQVLDQMERVYRTHYSNAHRSGHEMAAETTVAMEAARESIRRYVGASSLEEIVFTSGTTMSINLVARSWGDAFVGEGDEILLTEMEHHSNVVPWQQLAARRGAKIRWLPIDADYRLDLTNISDYLNARTKLVAVTAVSNVLGTINPIREIADAAHRVGSLVLVDAAQAVPHGPLSVEKLGADFLVFSGHKMLGPSGIGVLYGRKSLLESMPPMMGGGGMIDRVTFEGFTLAGLPNRFEAGTPPIVEAIAMKTAVEYLEEIGGHAILARERMLVAVAEERLRKIPGMKILGPASDQRSGVLSFVVDGTHPSDLGQFLDAQGIAVRAGHHCAMPLHAKLGLAGSCRASFYFYNTIEEAERFADAVGSAIVSLHSVKTS